MAIYHFSVKVMSRTKGHSAVAAAAYRSAERLYDERAREWCDYERRHDSVRESHIELPDGAPERWRNRQELWNEAERAERRRDAQVCREFEFALPRELGQDAQRELARGFIREEITARGMVADWAIHEGRGANPHVHCLAAMREYDPEVNGFARTKNRDWNDRGLVDAWREAWEETQNRALEREYDRQRVAESERQYVDCRSHAERGIDLEPQVHLGKESAHIEERARRAAEREGRGYEPVTDRGQENQRIIERNAERERIIERLREIADELRQRCERVVERARALVAREYERLREPGRERERGCEIVDESPRLEPERPGERTPPAERLAELRAQLQDEARERGHKISPRELVRQRMQAIERARERGLDFRDEGSLAERARAAGKALERDDERLARERAQAREWTRPQTRYYERDYGRDDWGRSR